MKPQDQHLVAPRRVTLRDGRDITVRLLGPNDGPGFRDFYASIPREDGIYYIGPKDRTPEKGMERATRWDAPFEVCLVLAMDDGSIHGEAWYRWNDRWNPSTKDRSLFGIAIRRTMQGVGAGRIIMSRLMEVGDLYGPPMMDLTVQVVNERAWKLYQSQGFVKVREQMRAARPEEDCPELLEWAMERKMGVEGKAPMQPSVA